MPICHYKLFYACELIIYLCNKKRGSLMLRFLLFGTKGNSVALILDVGSSSGGEGKIGYSGGVSSLGLSSGVGFVFCCSNVCNCKRVV